MSILRRKKTKTDFDINESILVDVMLNQFDELNENMKTLIIEKLIDHESRLAELEGSESGITIFGGGRGRD